MAGVECSVFQKLNSGTPYVYATIGASPSPHQGLTGDEPGHGRWPCSHSLMKSGLEGHAEWVALGLQTAQRRSCLCFLGPKVGIICIFGARLLWGFAQLRRAVDEVEER